MRQSALLPSPLLALVLAGCQPDEGFTFGDDASDDDATAGDDDSVPADDDATAADDDWDPRFDALAEAVEQERLLYGAPGVAVAVMERGEVTFAYGFGTRDAEGDEPVGPDTLFRIGSCTKVLTATAVLQLVEEGTVDLDDPVTTHVPGLDFAWEPVDEVWADATRVRDLLLHTTGMYDYIEIDAEREDEALLGFLTGDFLDIEFYMNPPGLFWNYSNPNYMVAGLVAEAASGTPYRERMRERVFAPLGMDRTLFTPGEVEEAGDYAVAWTYDWTGESDDTLLVGPESYENAWARPAGYAWSSVLDLLKFVDFLQRGEPSVLGDALRAEMQSPLVSTELIHDLDNYGYGLIVDVGFYLGSDWYDVKLVSHGGAIPGYAAEFFLLPEQDFAIAFLSNADGAYYHSSLATAIETLVQLPAPGEAPDLAIDEGSFPALVGSWNDPWQLGGLEITLEDGVLRLDAPLLDLYDVPYDDELVPYTPDNFVWTLQGYQFLLTVSYDDAGAPEWLHSRYFVYEREDGADLLATAESTPILDPERFRALAARAAADDAPRFGLAPIRREHLRDLRPVDRGGPDPLPCAPLLPCAD